MEFTVIDSVPESALRLGFNGYIPMGNDPQISENGAFTLELWAYVNAIESPANLIHKDYAEGLNYQLSLHKDGAIPYCKLHVGDEALTVNITNLYDRWIHFAFSVTPLDNISRLTLLVDGQIVAQSDLRAPWRDAYGDCILGMNFDGYLAEVRRWDIAWPVAMIKTKACQSLNGVEPHLRSWLPLTQADVITDVIQNIDYHGVLHQWQDKQRPVTVQTEQSLLLDQASESVSVFLQQGFMLQSFTLECWFRSYHATANSVLIDYSPETAQQGVRVYNPTNLTIAIGGVEAQTGINLVTGRWQHIAICWHSVNGQIKVYLNGRQAGETIELVPRIVLSASGWFSLGACNNGQHGHLGSYLADVRCWASCRSSDEIRHHYLHRLGQSESEQ